MLVDETIHEIWRDVGDGRKQPMRFWLSRLGATCLDYHCVIVAVLMMAETDLAKVIQKCVENKTRKKENDRGRSKSKNASRQNDVLCIRLRRSNGKEKSFASSG